MSAPRHHMSVAVIVSTMLTVTTSTAETGSQSESRLALAAAQLTAGRVCEELTNRFHPLSSKGRDGKPEITGTLWLSRCQASAEGMRLSVDFGGSGWRWIFRERETWGAEFELNQYVAFDAEVKISGILEFDYAPGNRVLTLQYRPQSSPEVGFSPLGDVKVNEEGPTAEVLGAAASLFMQGPDSQAVDEIASEGRKRLEQRFEDGLTLTADVCSGETRRRFGIEPGGDMLEPSENGAIDARLHGNSLLITGPHSVSDGGFAVTWEVADGGAVDARLVCESAAAKLADAHVNNRPLPAVDALATQTISASGTLRAPRGTSCPVAVVTRATAEPESDKVTEVSYRISAKPETGSGIDC